jgi:ATP-binding cassette subfamily B protein
VPITIAIDEPVEELTLSIGRPRTLPARECYRWVALVVMLFFLAVSGPATIGHLEEPAYLGRLGWARGDGTTR